MKLHSIDFKNFRCFKNEKIDFTNHSALVGGNNAGKSSILHAIDIFYTSTGKKCNISKNDFSYNSSEEPLEITYVFNEFEDDDIGDLKHYARAGELKFIIGATCSDGNNVNSVCRGIRNVIKDLVPFHDARTAAEKRKVYGVLIKDGINLPSWKNQGEAEANLRAYEENQTENFVEKESGDTAFGATGPANLIKKVFDWVYIPAVKEASEEGAETKNSAFTKLIGIAIRAKSDFAEKFVLVSDNTNSEISEILEQERKTLSELKHDLDREFKKLSSSKIGVSLEWDAEQAQISIPDPAVKSQLRDGEVIGGIGRFGHGLQRMYLMALLTLVAKYSADENSQSNVLIGIEEPELYQHPPQAGFLADSIDALAKTGAQIVATTHSPHFVDVRRFDDIRLIRKEKNASKVSLWKLEEQSNYYARIVGKAALGEQAAASSLGGLFESQAAELFFSGKVILVEGPEDRAILKAYLEVEGLYTEFLKNGCHFIICGGKNSIPKHIALCRGFGIPHFCIFDLDNSDGNSNQDNNLLVEFLKECPTPLEENPQGDKFTQSYVAWDRNIQKAIGDDCDGWEGIREKIATEWNWTSTRLDKQPLFLEAVIKRAKQNGPDISCLNKAVKAMQKFWEKDLGHD